MDEGVSKVGQDYARLREALREKRLVPVNPNQPKYGPKQSAPYNRNGAEAADVIEQLLADNERMRDALILADLTIRSFPRTDQSDVEFIRAALNSIQTTGDHQ